MKFFFVALFIFKEIRKFEIEHADKSPLNKLSAGSLKCYTELQAVKQNGTMLVYGYENVEAFKSGAFIKTHMPNFLTKTDDINSWPVAVLFIFIFIFALSFVMHSLINILRNSIVVDQYELLERLGKGGYGTVYKARHRIDKKLYAIKQILIKCDEFTSKSINEVKALANLRHPNIVQYRTSWTEGIPLGWRCLWDTLRSGTKVHLFITMELCDEDLQHWLKKNRQDFKIMQPLNKIRYRIDRLKIFEQIVSGVNEVHKNNLVHRDIKTSNICVTKEQVGDNFQFKLGDFGLALAENAHSAPAGTFPYMSPEQFYHSGQCTTEADIYPLGFVLFELLWPNSPDHPVLDLLRGKTFPDKFNEDFPREWNLIEKLLSDDKCNRPTCTKLLEEIESIYRDLYHDLLSEVRAFDAHTDADSNGYFGYYGYYGDGYF